MNVIISYLNSNYINLIFYAFCLVLFLYQNYQIFEMYFSYKTVNSISYASYSSISLPGLTVCIAKHLLLKDRSNIFNVTTNNSNNISSEQQLNMNLYEYINNFTIKEQFNNLYSYREVFGNSCWVLKPMSFTESDRMHINCGVISPIRQSIDYYKSCFTLLSQTKEESNEKYITSNDFAFNDYSIEMFNITIILDTITDVSVFLHSRKETFLSEFRYTDAVVFKRSTAKYSSIKYQKTIRNSLETPYETDCYKYQKDGHFSRNECINNCRISFLIEEFKAFPGNYLVYDNTSDMKMIEPFFVYMKDSTIDRKAGIFCRQKCKTRNECHMEYFVYSQVIHQYDWSRFTIFVFPPFVPDMIYNESPKLIFEEFVSYVGSLVGLWFGFSVIMLSRILNSAIIKLKRVYHVHFNPQSYAQHKRVFEINPIFVSNRRPTLDMIYRNRFN